MVKRTVSPPVENIGFTKVRANPIKTLNFTVFKILSFRKQSPIRKEKMTCTGHGTGFIQLINIKIM